MYNINMPKHSKRQEKTSRDKPRVAPKEPLVDDETDYWNKRILEGPLEQRIVAIKEAGEKKDVKALGALMEVFNEETVLDKEEGDYLDDLANNAAVCIVEANPGNSDILACVPDLLKTTRDNIIQEAKQEAKYLDGIRYRYLDDLDDFLDNLDDLAANNYEIIEAIPEVHSTYHWSVLATIAETNPDKPEIIGVIPEFLNFFKEVGKFALRTEGMTAIFGKIIDAFGTVIGKNSKNKYAPEAVSWFLENLSNNEPNSDIISALGKSGDRRAIGPLKQILYMEDVSDGVRYALSRLGLSKEEIFKAEVEAVRCAIEGWPEPKKDAEKYLHFGWQKAAYKIISGRRDAKKLVFENAKVLDILPDKQAWFTINEPQLAKDVLKLTVEKLGDKRGGLENALAATLGVKIRQLEEAHFTYYADEVLDTVAQVVRNSKLKDDKELSVLLSQIKYGADVKLRYVKREASDLTLGDKCGDCTATGSIHYGDSVMWLVNPAYQILKMSKGGRFIGKINFTLGKFGGEDAIIIDALEFNPQAQKGKPYHDDALECFYAAIEFLRDLAKKENRKLFGLETSNSSGAIEILESVGEQPVSKERMLKLDEAYIKDDYNKEKKLRSISLSLVVPNKDIRKILGHVGYKEKISLFYQLIEGTVDTKTGKDLIDERLPELEREVLNPAQIANPEIAAAMRERDFEKAASLILSDSGLEGKIKRILRLPDVKISPKLLEEKIAKTYDTEAMDIRSLEKTFNVDWDDFVKL